MYLLIIYVPNNQLVLIVGCAEKTVVSSTQYDQNRVDILRLMVAAFSDSLYQQADSYDSCKSMWLEVLCETSIYI